MKLGALARVQVVVGTFSASGKVQDGREEGEGEEGGPSCHAHLTEAEKKKRRVEKQKL